MEATSHPGRPWWRRPRAWLLVGFGWITLAAVAVAVAALDVSAGRQAARTAQDLSMEDVADGASIDPLRTARYRFSRAHRLLTSPPVIPLRLVPVLGRQLHSVSALSGAAAEMAGAGVEGVEEGRRILEAPRETGSERLEQVRRLGRLAGRLERRLTAVDLGPEDSLLAALRDARAQVSAELAELHDALRRGSAGASTLADMLQGPSSYLVVAANNAEMRAGTGMFLQLGRLVTDEGRFRLEEMTSVTEVVVPPGAAEPGGDMAERWGWLNPGSDWRNLMLSPRFPASAELAARMWAASGREPVEGVLVLDPVALAAIVEATGPISVGGREISGGEVVAELLHEQYVRRPELTERDDRREELAGIATAAIRALDEGGWKPAVLARELARAAAGRHVLAWARHRSANEGWRAAGVGGAMSADSALVALLNRGGNKLDQFVSVSAELAITPQATHADGQLRIRLRNETPPGEVSYIAGPHYGLPLAPGEYLGILAVTLPGATEQAAFEGVERLAVAGPDGATRVIGYELRLLPGQEHVAVLNFRLAEPHGTLVVEPSARVPAAEWSWGVEKWRDHRAHRVSW